MHRKTNSLYSDYLNSSSTKSSLYEGSRIPAYSPAPEPTHTPTESHQTHHRKNGHTRNYSDLGTHLKTFKDEHREIKQVKEISEESKIKILEQRIQKIQIKLAKNQKNMGFFNIDQVRDYVLAEITAQKETENKNQEISACLNQIKEKLWNLSKANADSYLKMGRIEQEYSSASTDKIIQKMGKLSQDLIESIRKQIRIKANQLNDKIRRITSENPFEVGLLKSNRKCSNSPISFIYQQYIRNVTYSHNKNILKQNRNQHQDVCINQVVYYLDPEGYLLDNNNYYLMDKQMKPVKLSEPEIRVLRKQNVLA